MRRSSKGDWHTHARTVVEKRKRKIPSRHEKCTSSVMCAVIQTRNEPASLCDFLWWSAMTTTTSTSLNASQRGYKMEILRFRNLQKRSQKLNKRKLNTQNKVGKKVRRTRAGGQAKRSTRSQTNKHLKWSLIRVTMVLTLLAKVRAFHGIHGDHRCNKQGVPCRYSIYS